jgi:hypothetical protein
MTSKVQSPPDIFEKIKNRGIDFEVVHRIVQVERPHDTLFSAQWYRGRSISQVLKHLEKWRAFLEKDFILSLSGDLKAKLEGFVLRTELLVWRALIEANHRVGPRDLQVRWIPTGRDENGHKVFIQPDREIVAVHRETKEMRRARLPGGRARSLALQAEDHRRAFQELGLWDQLWKGDLSRIWTSKRKRQGWPLFTRLIIPRLYEFMAPHYTSPGNYSARLDGTNAKAERPSLFQKELLQDMVEILKMEHEYAFQNATLDQLKAVLQRYLAKRKQSAPSQ